MKREGNINIVEEVKLMIYFNHYILKDFEPYIDQITQTYADILSYYNKALDEKNTVTQQLYHLIGRLDDMKLKVTVLKRDLLLEIGVRLLNETKLGVSFDQRDLNQVENVHLNLLIEKIFNESKAIKNLVNNGSTNNTYNQGWSNGFNT